MDTSDKARARLERMCELTNVGAGWAAASLSQLASRSMHSALPVVRDNELPEYGPWTTAVFFDVEGSLPGLLALLLTPAACEAMVGALVGTGPEALAAADSAVTEIGNIVASQTLSAIADEIGERLLPSVPTLARGDVEAELAANIARRQGRAGARIESLLVDAESKVRALLVLAPDVLAS